MTNDEIVKQCREYYPAEKVVLLAADALENAMNRADSDAKIIRDLQKKLEAAWMENRELRAKLNKN